MKAFKVLVVDDEIIVAKALSRAFASRGHSVAIAHTGEEGVDKWQEFSPQVVLLDVVMPGLTGPQVIEEYKRRSTTDEQLSPAQIILMTAHSGIKGREAAMELGAHDFIQKPFENIFELVERVETLLGKAEQI
ncbi:MAG: response regulator [Oligoflexia bacterium]|nr:response regulator [Oligoflexia bacterium]